MVPPLPTVPIRARKLDRLAEVVDQAVLDDTVATLERLRRDLAGRAVWSVNSTARGGGVAELLQALIAYLRQYHVDARWATIEGDDQFFRITKRLHHALHGAHGDGSPLGAAERRHYEEISDRNAARFSAMPREGDFVILHDPQTAGLIKPLARRGCRVVWRCHIGYDETNLETALGWRFLEPELADAEAYVFSRDAYVPGLIPDDRCAIVPPSIDPLTPKNQPLDEAVIHSVLWHSGLVDGAPPSVAPQFRREDGSLGLVGNRAEVLRSGRVPRLDDRLVVQVSRWDPLKDPVGVMRGFVAAVHGNGLRRDAHLILAGPDVRSVADDPEGAATYREVVRQWEALPDDVRDRIHLANLPMDDVEENATIVNALQRHATIVVQKSLKEGFGLTVTEAMAKARPVVASRVGGIQDQIVHGDSGWLIDDPEDVEEFAGAVASLLDDPEEAGRLGAGARRRVVEHFLCNRHFRQYADLLSMLDSAGRDDCAGVGA